MTPTGFQFVCTKCAKEKGATWPKDHYATFHNGKCIVCEKQANVCTANDWMWPKDEDKTNSKRYEKWLGDAVWD